MAPLLLLTFFAVLFIAELLYFKLADKYNIIDKPNARSSHTKVTVRGGGVIFCIGALLFFVAFGFQYPLFILGLALISFISFLDDIFVLNNKVRLAVHICAVGLLFLQWRIFDLHWYLIIVAGIFVIGSINAYNFMDGINGITCAYSLVTISTLLYINEHIVFFSSSHLLILIISSLLVFGFFNFRLNARCFAGDVGSMGIAFLVVFFIGQLVIQTGSFHYILLLLLYGVDTVTTILFRLFRKENIFEAHRSHFYQYLSNQLKWPHLFVAGLYALAQGVINLSLVAFIGTKPSAIITLYVLLATFLLFVVLRFCVEGPAQLLHKKKVESQLL